MAKTSFASLSGKLINARLIRYGLGLVNAIVIARFLGVEKLGIYAYAIGLTSLFSLLPNMGISTFLTKSIAINHGSSGGIIRKSIFLQFFLAGIIMVLIPFIASLLPVQPVSIYFIFLAAVHLGVNSLSWPFLAIISGKSRFDLIALIELISAFSGSVLTISFAIIFKSVEMILYAHIFGSLLSYVISRYFSRTFIKEYNESEYAFSSLLKNSISFAGIGLFQSIYTRVDIVLIGQLSTVAMLGFYNAAYKPINILVYLGGSIAGALFPKLAQIKENEALFRKAIRLLSVLSPVFAIIICGFSFELIQLLFGQDFAPASAVLSVLIWSVVFNWLYLPLGTLMQATGYEKGWMVLIIIGLLLNVIGNIVLIPAYGALGAAWATLISELIVFTAACILISYCKITTLPFSIYLKVLVLGLMGAVLYLSIGNIIGTFLALFCYLSGIFYLKVLTVEDCKYIFKNLLMVKVEE